MGFISEVGMRLTADNSQFKNTLKESEKETAGFADNIAGKVGNKLFGLQAIATTIGTVLGLNLQKIAEGIARVWTGMTKDEEDAFKKLEEVSTKATDLAIKNMRAQLSEEQKYQQALEERAKLQRQVDVGATSSGQDQLRLAQLKLKLEEKQSEILAHELKQRQEIEKQEEETIKQWEAGIKSRVQAAEKTFQAELATLSQTEKVEMLKRNIAAQEHLIASGAAGRIASEAQSIILQERKNQLIGAQHQLAEELDREAEKAFKKGQEQMRDKLRADDELAAKKKEIAILLLKGEENLTDVEKEKLALLQGQTSEAKQRAEIETLLAKGVKNLTDAEKARLGVLVGQTEEIKKQKEAVEALKVSIRTIHGREDKDLSDRELGEKIANLKRGIAADEMTDPAGKYRYLNNQSRLDLERAQFEVGRRGDFRKAYGREGDAALNRFSAFDEQTLRNYVRPEDEKRAQQTLDALQQINRRLGGSKLFPLNG